MPPIPGNNRRVTPPAGCIISGLFVPGDTIVANDLYAAGRSANLFHRPDKWLPERYLADCLEEFKDNKQKEFQPFFVSPRNCISKALAYTKIRIIILK